MSVNPCNRPALSIVLHSFPRVPAGLLSFRDPRCRAFVLCFFRRFSACFCSRCTMVLGSVFKRGKWACLDGVVFSMDVCLHPSLLIPSTSTPSLLRSMCSPHQCHSFIQQCHLPIHDPCHPFSSHASIHATPVSSM